MTVKHGLRAPESLKRVNAVEAPGPCQSREQSDNSQISAAIPPWRHRCLAGVGPSAYDMAQPLTAVPAHEPPMSDLSSPLVDIAQKTSPAGPNHRSITGKMVFLGTGTSHGVPMIGCTCATCMSTDPKNHRTRCAVALGLPDGNLLIDTPPELRLQLLRQGIGIIHAVAYTHGHADHLFGLDDLRIFPRYLGTDVPIYCQAHVEQIIRRAFSYAFDPQAQDLPAGGVPRLAFHRLTGEPFELLGARLIPVPLVHGQAGSLGFRIGNVAYCTDTKAIPPSSAELLQGLEVLILDGLRHHPHPTHLSVPEALQVIRQLRPRRTYLTHIAHQLEHHTTNQSLPSGVELAYDGLTISLV